jgi:hypothetical protein
LLKEDNVVALAQADDKFIQPKKVLLWKDWFYF